MYVIITCKYEKDPIKNSREKVETSFFQLQAYGDFFRHSQANNSAVGGPIRPKFELFRDLMHVIIACKYEKEVITRFDVYETLCPQQMLVHKGGQIKNWSGEYRDIIPTKLQCQAIQRALQNPNLQREIIRKK